MGIRRSRCKGGVRTMASRLNVKWLDESGNEVEKDKATYALVTTYDKDGQVVDESFGTVEPDEEVADQS